MKTLFTVLLSLFAGAVLAQTNLDSSIDLSAIGAEAAQDCAENADCLVQENIAGAASTTDLSAFESSSSSSAAEFALAAAALGGGYVAYDALNSDGSDNGAAPNAEVEQVQEFDENGSFNIRTANDQTDLNRMDDEMLLLALNEPLNSGVDCSYYLLDGQVLTEECTCNDTRCWECAFAVAPDPNIGSAGQECISFSYSSAAAGGQGAPTGLDRNQLENGGRHFD